MKRYFPGIEAVNRLEAKLLFVSNSSVFHVNSAHEEAVTVWLVPPLLTANAT
jgi:hypothetical protein